MTLSAYEQWMVKSNLKSAREDGRTPHEQAELLRGNGYHRVADAVEASGEEPPPIEVIEEHHDEVEEGRRERRDFLRNRDY
jgi:hypothetical protein